MVKKTNSLDNIFDNVLDVVLGLGLQKVSNNVSKALRLGGMSLEQKLKQDRSHLTLKKAEMDIAREKRREEEARERAAIQWQKHQRQQVLDEKRTLPCSVLLKGEYGIDKIYAGAPVVLGEKGVERIIELALTDDESAKLNESAQQNRKVAALIHITC